MDQSLALKQFCGIWEQKLQLAKDHRYKVFGKDAAQAMKYYIGPHDFVYERKGDKDGLTVVGGDEPLNAPPFRMTLNKVSEMVQIFGPMLYAQNPVRVCKPRHTWKAPKVLSTGPEPDPNTPPDMGTLSGYMQGLQKWVGDDQQAQMQDAIMQGKADLIEQYLNYTPNELGLEGDFRLAIDQSIVSGRGTLWTEVYIEPKGDPNEPDSKLIGSFFGDVEELLIDPDVKLVKDAKWIARECIEPIWKLERDYGLPPDLLKGTMDSVDTKAMVGTSEEGTAAAKKGKTADLVRYWKVWSKMGMGVRLKDSQVSQSVMGPAAQLSEQFGDYVYMVLVPSVSYPVNMKPALVEAAFANGDENAIAELRPAVQWPIPFWKDDEWPVTMIDPHPQFDCPWPISHLRPALGEQIFLDWGYSSLASHIHTSCRDFIIIAKSAGEDIRNTIINGKNLTIIELDAVNKSIKELVDFLQHPPINKDIFTILEAIEKNFEKRTGLTDMLYAQTGTQSRSAADASTKSSAMQIRTDDMAKCVEKAATSCARKEAIAARLLLTGQDVQPILGDQAAAFWDQYVASQDVRLVCREFDYRIEASSARKPNKDTDIANTSEAAQTIFPTLMQQAQAAMQAGNPDPWKAVNAFLRDWAKARGYLADDYLLPEPDPVAQQYKQMQQQQQAPPQQAPQGAPPPQGGPPAPQGPPPQMQPPQAPLMQVTPQ